MKGEHNRQIPEKLNGKPTAFNSQQHGEESLLTQPSRNVGNVLKQKKQDG